MEYWKNPLLGCWPALLLPSSGPTVCGCNINIDQFCGYWRLSQYPALILPTTSFCLSFKSGRVCGRFFDKLRLIAKFTNDHPLPIWDRNNFTGFGTKMWHVWLNLNRLVVSRLSQIPFIVSEPEAEQFIHSKLNLIAYKGRNACFTKCGPFIIFMYGQKLQHFKQFDILHAINLYISRPPRKGNSNLYLPANL